MPFCFHKTFENGYCTHQETGDFFVEAPDEPSGIGINSIFFESLINNGWKLKILNASENPKGEPELLCGNDENCVGRWPMP